MQLLQGLDKSITHYTLVILKLIPRIYIISYNIALRRVQQDLTSD